MNITEPIALIDMDDTLVDYSSVVSQATMPMHEMQNQIGFWLNLPKLQIGFDVLSVIEKVGFQPHILTKGPYKSPNGWSEKMLWCRKHVPQAKITITEDKGLVYGKILFDDWAPYIKRWLEWRPRGLVIMLDYPHNRGFEHPQVIRVLQDKSNLQILEEQLESFF